MKDLILAILIVVIMYVWLIGMRSPNQKPYVIQQCETSPIFGDKYDCNFKILGGDE